MLGCNYNKVWLAMHLELHGMPFGMCITYTGCWLTVRSQSGVCTCWHLTSRQHATWQVSTAGCRCMHVLEYRLLL